MGMDIDEARRKYMTGARNTLEGVAVGEISNGSDPALGDRDVRGKWCSTASVVDQRALEDRPEQRLT